MLSSSYFCAHVLVQFSSDFSGQWNCICYVRSWYHCLFSVVLWHSVSKQTNELLHEVVKKGKWMSSHCQSCWSWLLDNSRIANSRTGRLVDWTSRGLVNSRTGQVADWTTRGCHRRLCVLSFPFWRHLRDRELSSPRDVQSVSLQSASWHIRKLSSYPHHCHLLVMYNAATPPTYSIWAGVISAG